MSQNKQQLCFDYMSNKCARDRCKFLHDDTLCKYYFQNQKCKFGHQCRHKHVEPPQKFLNRQQPRRSNNSNNNRSNSSNNNNNHINSNNITNRTKNKRKPKNTETFEPSFEPPDMRIVYSYVKNNQMDHPLSEHYDRPNHTSRDMIMVSNLFCDESDLSIYNQLLQELRDTQLDENQLWKSWHGDSHLIADDHLKWKEKCPLFARIILRTAEYFNMEIKATRFNWYRDSTEWKPFHHDAAAVKPDKARTQNFTVGISFGATREAAFEHSNTKGKGDRSIISIPLPNGSIYAFSKDVNIEWKHGILRVPDDQTSNEGRISIIAWGWRDQIDQPKPRN